MKNRVICFLLILSICVSLFPSYASAEETPDFVYPDGAIVLREGETYEIPLIDNDLKTRGFSQYATLSLSVDKSYIRWTLTPSWYAVSPSFYMEMKGTDRNGLSSGTYYVSAFSGSKPSPGAGGHVIFSGSFSCIGCYDTFFQALWVG